MDGNEIVSCNITVTKITHQEYCQLIGAIDAALAQARSEEWEKCAKEEIARLKVELGEIQLVLESQGRKLHKAMEEGDILHAKLREVTSERDTFERSMNLYREERDRLQAEVQQRLDEMNLEAMRALKAMQERDALRDDLKACAEALQEELPLHPILVARPSIQALLQD